MVQTLRAFFHTFCYQNQMENAHARKVSSKLQGPMLNSSKMLI